MKDHCQITGIEIGIEGKERMTDSKLKQAATEFANKIKRGSAYADFTQGALWERERSKVLVEALEFVANDLDLIAVTPTEISHLAKLQNALKQYEAADE
jgi:hypothetical protein